jgi:UDP-glucose:(heptosyl)LPS alpha-1,3-glucosyltransferase
MSKIMDWFLSFLLNPPKASPGKSVVMISQKDLYATRSGVPRKVLEEVKYFHQLGYEVYAVAERINKDIYQSAGAKTFKTLRWPISGFFRRKFYMLQFAILAKKLNPKIIIGHGDIVEQDIAYIHNCVHLAYKLLNGNDIPTDHQVAKIHQEILQKQKFKVLVCNSQMMQTDLCERFTIPKDKTKVIYPEYNPKKFNGNGKELIRKKRRQELNIDEDMNLIGLITSGNFKKRNVKLLIEAYAQLPDVLKSKSKVIIAGKDKFDKYLKQIQELDLEDHFIFLPSINEVEEYYHMIDIFVLPALIEEFGRSVLEAMACGLPVIVSKTVGASEILESQSKDFIINPLDSREFTLKLKLLLENRDLRLELGKLNTEIALKYTDKEQANKFDKLIKDYEGVLG